MDYNKIQFFNLDDAQTVFFRRQLEEIDQQLYDVKHGKLEALELVNTKPLNLGVESYTYRQFDKRGLAVITANYANGAPRADVEGKEFTSYIRSVREAYGFNIQEIRSASMAGLPLDAMKAMAARRAVEETLNRVGLLGDAEWSLIGLFNQPNASSYTIPNGAALSPLWANKTGDEILEDLYGLVDSVPAATAEIEKVTRVLMPYSRYRLITRRRVGSTITGTVNNNKVLEEFLTVRPGIEVRGALFLDTAGAGGTARLVGYNPDRVNVEWLLPVPFESFPPQWNALEWTIECHARVGGVVMRYPLTMVYGDGI